ncbi:hypothetical protein JCM3766R1_005611 [Sporobolomyces carnicolor]
MPRLRMKPSTSADEAVLRASRRARKKSTTARRRHGPDDESISPPRHRPRRPDPANDDDFDESSLPPEQAYKRTRTQDEEDEDRFEFAEKLKEAANLDRGVEYHEQEAFAYSTSYGTAAGNAAGIRGRGGGGSSTAYMDEEEYAEYIRAGMWRRQNKERLEQLARLERERERREAQEEADRREHERKERLRRDRAQRDKRRQVEAERSEARERYELGWKRLQLVLQQPQDASTTKGACLRFTDFVWPSFPPFALPPITWPSPHELDASSIQDFLFPPDLSADDRKAKMRSAVLSYHPDRFERLVDKIVQDDHDDARDGTGDADRDGEDDGEGKKERAMGRGDVKERVRELGLRVSQVLNDLLKEEKLKKSKT